MRYPRLALEMRKLRKFHFLLFSSLACVFVNRSDSESACLVSGHLRGAALAPEGRSVQRLARIGIIQVHIELY